MIVNPGISESQHVFLIMAVLWNRTGHYIFILWFFIFLFSSFSLA